MKPSTTKIWLCAAFATAVIWLTAQNTTPPGYNPDKMQTPNTKPGSRTQDGLMGVTGFTGMRGVTGTKGSTGPTGQRGVTGHTKAKR